MASREPVGPRRSHRFGSTVFSLGKPRGAGGDAGGASGPGGIGDGRGGGSGRSVGELLQSVREYNRLMMDAEFSMLRDNLPLRICAIASTAAGRPEEIGKIFEPERTIFDEHIRNYLSALFARDAEKLFQTMRTIDGLLETLPRDIQVDADNAQFLKELIGVVRPTIARMLTRSDEIASWMQMELALAHPQEVQKVVGTVIERLGEDEEIIPDATVASDILTASLITGWIAPEGSGEIAAAAVARDFRSAGRLFSGALEMSGLISAGIDPVWDTQLISTYEIIQFYRHLWGLDILDEISETHETPPVVERIDRDAEQLDEDEEVIVVNRFVFPNADAGTLDDPAKPQIWGLVFPASEMRGMFEASSRFYNDKSLRNNRHRFCWAPCPKQQVIYRLKLRENPSSTAS